MNEFSGDNFSGSGKLKLLSQTSPSPEPNSTKSIMRRGRGGLRGGRVKHKVVDDTSKDDDTCSQVGAPVKDVSGALAKEALGAPEKEVCVEETAYPIKGDLPSKGDVVKSKCDVIRTRTVDHAKKKLNVNCRVETVGCIMKSFYDLKRKWVNEMGFESLFNLYDKQLPRFLCYWVATRVDVDNKCMRSVDGVVIPLTKVQVHWVLGISLGAKVVPTDPKSPEVSALWDKYMTATPSGTTDIMCSTVLALVEGPADDEVVFKRAFMMMVLGDFLCPTTCHRLSVSLLPAVTVAVDAAQYDWCSFVIEHLMEAINGFSKRFNAEGYAPGCGGCNMFLAIVYLDRLRRPPVQWGVFPRLRVWTKKEIKDATNRDQLDGLDFGKLGTFDVAYGERHPLEGRDIMPPKSTTVIDRVISVIRAIDVGASGPSSMECQSSSVQSTDVQREGPVRKRRGATTNLNPYEYANRRKKAALLSASNGNEDGSAFSAVQHPSIGGKEAGGSLPQDMVPINDSVDADSGNMEQYANVESNLAPSSPVSYDDVLRWCEKLPETLDVEPEVVVEVTGRGDSLEIAGGELISNETIMLSCNGLNVSLATCASLSSRKCPLHKEYVKAACEMYKKVWDRKHTERSKRFMLDPDFGSKVVNALESQSVVDVFGDAMQKFVDSFRVNSIDDINMVKIFVPILEGDHWWCAVFSIISSEVAVFDSMEETNAADAHHLQILNLKQGMDHLLHLVDSSWSIGTCFEFKVYTIQMPKQGQLFDSGVLMLVVIKRRADRLGFDVYMESLDEEIPWVLCEDILNDYNEAKQSIIGLLQQHIS